jgi:hypothetical protein
MRRRKRGIRQYLEVRILVETPRNVVWTLVDGIVLVEIEVGTLVEMSDGQG